MARATKQKPTKQQAPKHAFALTDEQLTVLGAVMWFIVNDRSAAAYGVRELLRFGVTSELPESIQRGENAVVDALTEIASDLGVV